MMRRPLIELRSAGLYCPRGEFYIDPVRPVEKAIVTHGHGDHCKPGSRAMLASPETCAIAKTRYGETAFGAVQSLIPGRAIRIGDVSVTLVPAGHILGSTQVVIERGGQRNIISGDYKRSADPTCSPFEPIPCDLFVTEATFGYPVFAHPPIRDELDKLLAALRAQPDRCHVIGAYALGKAQRIIVELRTMGWDRPIYLHGALVKLCDLYQSLGLDLGILRQVTEATQADLTGQIVLAPPSALSDRWARRLPSPVPVGASGWMQVRARARQGRVELPLIISDHADWAALQQTIRDVQAETVWVTHGAEDALCHWCETVGINARPLSIAGRMDDGE